MDDTRSGEDQIRETLGAAVPPPMQSNGAAPDDADETEEPEPSAVNVIAWMDGLLTIKLPWPPGKNPKKRRKSKKPRKPTQEELNAQRKFDLEVKDAVLDTLARAGDLLFDKRTREKIRKRVGLSEKQLGPELTKRRREIQQAKVRVQAEAIVGEEIEPERQSSKPGHAGYFALGGRLYRREEDARHYLIADFDAWIVEEITFVGGMNPRKEFVIEGRTPHGPLPRIRVPCGEFEAMKWAVEQWGSEARIHAGRTIRDHVRAAILALPKAPVLRRPVYEQTGWEKDDGELIYLHGKDGAIGKDGALQAVSVELGDSLMHHGLRLPSTKDEERTAIEASLELFDLAPLHVMAPVMGITYVAPLVEFVGDIDLVGYLHGGTQGFKSETAALAQAHFGDYTRETLPLSFRSTANYIDAVLYQANHSLVVVDNYRPAADDQERRKNAEKLYSVLYGKGDTAGRGRLDREARQKRTYFPRAATIITAELLPMVGSAIGRGFIVPVKASSRDEAIVGDIDVVKLTEAQKARGLYRVAMASYIKWLAREGSVLREQLPTRLAAIRLSLQGNANFRQVTQVAHIMLGLETFTRFAVKAGAMSEQQRAKLLTDSAEALELLAKETSNLTSGESAVATFRSYILDGLASQRIHLEAKNGGPPITSEGACGWRKVEGSWELPLGSRRIGFIDDDWLYLIPTELTAYLQEVANRTKRALPVGQATLYQLLDERKLIEVEFEERVGDVDGAESQVIRRRTKNVDIPALGSKPRVLKILCSFFWRLEGKIYDL